MEKMKVMKVTLTMYTNSQLLTPLRESLLNENKQSHNLNKTPKKKLKTNSEWYRKNKLEKKVIHSCPHCLYSTTGPKSVLQNHIYSKHTEEKDRPFQCPHKNCNRGYAQKCNLIKHMEKVHNHKTEKKQNKTIVQYRITLLNKIPNNVKTFERYCIYQNHAVITQDILDKYNLKPSYILYDAKKGYINVTSYTQNDLHLIKKNNWVTGLVKPIIEQTNIQRNIHTIKTY